MQRFLILFLLTTACLGAQGQQLDPNDYIYPLRELKQRLYSANFGEIRPGHFHAGVDIKTDAEEGKPVVAAADGYVSRVVLQAGGYGRAVYLTLRNGTTVVYGHLRRFRDDIERHVRRERYERRSNGVNLWFGPGTWPVKQGDVVAYSGDSGSSGGPHLHYEIRDTETQRLYNPVREGIIRPRDEYAAAHRAPALRRGRHRAGRARAQRPGELRRGPHGRRPLRPDARRTRRRRPQGLFRGRSHRPPQRCLELLRGMARHGLRGRHSLLRIPHGQLHLRHIALQRCRELLPDTNQFAQRGDPPGPAGGRARQFLPDDGGTRADTHGGRARCAASASRPRTTAAMSRRWNSPSADAPGSSAPRPTPRP